jgi:hypothetical protein
MLAAAAWIIQADHLADAFSQLHHSIGSTLHGNCSRCGGQTLPLPAADINASDTSFIATPVSLQRQSVLWLARLC